MVSGVRNTRTVSWFIDLREHRLPRFVRVTLVLWNRPKLLQSAEKFWEICLLKNALTLASEYNGHRLISLHLLNSTRLPSLVLYHPNAPETHSPFHSLF